MSGAMRVSAETRFAIIPEWVLFAKISPNAVRLYGVLARHADKEEHFAIVGRQRLADQMRCATDTVDRAMVELMNLGAVEVEHRLNPNNPAHKLENRYHLRVVPAQGSRTDAPARTRAPSRKDARSRRDAEEDLERGLGSKALRSAHGTHNPPKAAASRPRDPVFEALAEIQGHGWADLNSAERGKLNKARRLAAESKATPEAIRKAASRWPDVMGDATMTAIGVMSNFHRLLTGPQRPRLPERRKASFVDRLKEADRGR